MPKAGAVCIFFRQMNGHADRPQTEMSKSNPELPDCFGGRMSERLETATLGAGCFWCVEAVFQNLKGVENVVSGYAGGRIPYPTYEQVSMGTTGHAESVQITFDPQIITYADILHVFWNTHDPTTMNRQGHDIGTQYRSVIFYHDDQQKAEAEKSKAEADASGSWSAPIITQIVPFSNFYPAEDYHQDYYRTNPDEAYCRVVIDPKIQKMQKEFVDRLRDKRTG